MGKLSRRIGTKKKDQMGSHMKTQVQFFGSSKEEETLGLRFRVAPLSRETSNV